MTKRPRLARTRKTAGYTQESFAEALGVDRSTVARWEAGAHEPLPYVRPKMARLLAVSRDELSELLRPVMIDGHPVLLPLDGTLLKGRGHREFPTQDDGGRGWSSADGTLNYAEKLDSTLHMIAELSDKDLKRRTFSWGLPSPRWPSPTLRCSR